jgi:hypothetical protein
MDMFADHSGGKCKVISRAPKTALLNDVSEHLHTGEFIHISTLLNTLGLQIINER